MTKASIASALPPAFPSTEISRLWTEAHTGKVAPRVGIFEFTVENFLTAVTDGENAVKLRFLSGELARDLDDEDVLRNAARVRYELRTNRGTLTEDVPLNVDDFDLETPVIRHDGDAITIDVDGTEGREKTISLDLVDDADGVLTTDLCIKFDAKGSHASVIVTAEQALAFAHAIAYYVRATRVITGWADAVDVALDDILGTEEPVQDVLPDADADETTQDEQP